jgi:hypothetical protein
MKFPGHDMQDHDTWLVDYGKDHQDLRFAGIYWVAVLGLVFATVGMLWSLPVPAEFKQISPALNWGSTFLMAAIVYYFIISMPLAIGMLPFVLGIAAIQIWLRESPWPQPQIVIALFAASLIGLSLGRLSNGGMKAVFRDIQSMMIAPFWLLSVVYRRFGIPF